VTVTLVEPSYPKKTMLYADQSFIHFGIRDFRLFCSCNLDLDPMTFMYDYDPYFLEMYGMCENKLPSSMLSKVIV